MKLCNRFAKRMDTSNAFDGYFSSKLDEKLSAMPARTKKTTLTEELGLFWSEVEAQYIERPANTVFMFVFAAIILGALLYGISYIIPITDPSHL